jgi:hypothetical protein
MIVETNYRDLDENAHKLGGELTARVDAMMGERKQEFDFTYSAQPQFRTPISSTS